MHIRLYNWERALEIAQQYKKHVDTVVAYRVSPKPSIYTQQSAHTQTSANTHTDVLVVQQRYLEQCERPENLPKFTAASQSVTVDWDAIARAIQAEKEAESARPGAKPYGE